MYVIIIMFNTFTFSLYANITRETAWPSVVHISTIVKFLMIKSEKESPKHNVKNLSGASEEEVA